MFYYIGWFIIFLGVLFVTDFFSRHIRVIILTLLKVSVAVFVTAVLAFMVYLNENRAQVQVIVQRAYDRLNQL